MREVDYLRGVNLIVCSLSGLGSIAIFIWGFNAQCVEYCGRDNYAEFGASPLVIALGLAGLLYTLLIYHLINVFAVHVEKSHPGKGWLSEIERPK